MEYTFPYCNLSIHCFNISYSVISLPPIAFYSHTFKVVKFDHFKIKPTFSKIPIYFHILFLTADSPTNTASHTPPADWDTGKSPAGAARPAAGMPLPSAHTDNGHFP